MQVAEVALLPPVRQIQSGINFAVSGNQLNSAQGGELAEIETTEITEEPVSTETQNTKAQKAENSQPDSTMYKEALALWYRVALDTVHSNSCDLSNRQMALLLTLNSEIGPHTVRSLSAHLKISKPAICRALDTLSKFELATRIVDQSDRRNVFIFLTENGRNFLKKFSATIMNCLSEVE